MEGSGVMQPASKELYAV